MLRLVSFRTCVLSITYRSRIIFLFSVNVFVLSL